MHHANETAKHGTPPPSHASCPLWHVAFAINDVRKMTVDELDQAYQAGSVHSRTVVWTEGMGDWAPLGEVAALDEEEEVAQPSSSGAASVAYARLRANPTSHGRSMAPVALSIPSQGPTGSKPSFSAWGGWVLAATAVVVAGAGGWLLTGESPSAERRSPVSEAPPPRGAAQPVVAAAAAPKALKAPAVPLPAAEPTAVHPAAAAAADGANPPAGNLPSGSLPAAELTTTPSKGRVAASAALQPAAEGAIPTEPIGAKAVSVAIAGDADEPSAEAMPPGDPPESVAEAAARERKLARRLKRKASARRRRRAARRASARRASARRASARRAEAQSAESAFDPLNGSLP